ncbi:MAG: type II secretion system F family protein [Nanoarchaeota archaeon]|nr:type II secretion system F family protein [Nanoarchaeota archaeon]
MYRFVAKFYPKKLKKIYADLLRYSGKDTNPEKFAGFIASFGFLFAFALAFFLGLFFKLPVVISAIASFFLFQVLVYFLLLLSADAKAKFVEEILPDVLQLMASNLRAGLTTDRALLLAARPEFGPFQNEINQVGKEITMGEEIGRALVNMTKRIRSQKLSKTVALIVSGLKSGGELASLLEQTARNLRQESLVDSRIRANVMMYVIFIFIAVCFGAPLLFGLSSFLVEVLTENMKAIKIPDTAAMTMPISFSEVSIGVDFVIMFSVIFLITASILGSLIVGLLSKGREREGIRYMPVLVIFSLAMFFLVRVGIKNMVGGLFGL